MKKLLNLRPGSWWVLVLAAGIAVAAMGKLPADAGPGSKVTFYVY